MEFSAGNVTSGLVEPDLIAVGCWLLVVDSLEWMRYVWDASHQVFIFYGPHDSFSALPLVHA